MLVYLIHANGSAVLHTTYFCTIRTTQWKGKQHFRIRTILTLWIPWEHLEDHPGVHRPHCENHCPSKLRHHENHWVGGWGRCMQKWRLAPSLDAWGTAGSGQILSCHGSGDFWENWVCVSRNLGELQYRTENFPQIRMPSWRGWGAMGERNFGYLSAQMGSPFMVCIRHSVYLVAALYWEQACTQGLLAWRFLKCRSLLE